MLKKFLVLIAVISIFSCQNDKKVDGFIINANINESANGKLVKLTSIDRDNPSILDSARIAEGKLTLQGEIAYPDMYILSIEDVPASFPIVIENTKMNVELYMDSLQNSNVVGSKENDLFNVFKNNAKPLQKQNQILGSKFREAQSQGDMAAMQAIRQSFDSLVEINKNESIKTIQDNNGLAISAIMLEDFLRAKGISTKKAEELYTNFTEDIKNTRAGKEIKRAIEATLATEIGSKAPNFSGTTPEGETLALKDVMGKVTIVDFWAAWCGPCRKENPNVVKVYNKYHEKGLEIIGVSLDGSNRQKNPKEAWVQAIEKDSLNWHHVSSLQYFNDPIAKLYNINSIPATFILDKEGNIVAKNLRGPALEQKISELLD